MTLAGPVVLDIAQHFIERWNEVKKRKVRTSFLPHHFPFILHVQYKNDAFYDYLAFPHNWELAPNEPIARHPHLKEFEEIGRRFRQRFHLNPEDPFHRFRSGGGEDEGYGEGRGEGEEEREARVRELEEERDEDVFPRAPHGTCTVQVVRSVSDWSHGVLVEDSIQKACEFIFIFTTG